MMVSARRRKHSTHEEESEIEVGEGSPSEEKLNRIIDEFDL